MATTAAEQAAPAEEPSMMDQAHAHAMGYMPDHHHDVPVVGIFSSAYADAFAGEMDEEHLKAAFKAIDTDNSGTLDKTELSAALREIGKSERQIQKVIDRMPKGSNEIDFAGFQALVQPADERDAMTTWTVPGVGAEVPMPNGEKIYDVPVLGGVLAAGGDILMAPIDHALRSSWRYWQEADDDKLAVTFKELDTDNSGTLEKSEIAKGLRHWGNTEAEIAATIKDIDKPLSLYEFKVMVRGPKFQQHTVNYIPLGSVVTHNLAGHPEWTDEELREAWDHVTGKMKGKKSLNKMELHDLMIEHLGLSNFQAQKLIDAMEPGVETLDFDGLKEHLEPKSREYMTEFKGVPLPNPGKIHDVPVIGHCTSLAQDGAIHSYNWTIGALLKKFQGMSDEDLQEKFNEIDKNKNGKLSGDEIHQALRNAGMTEVQIKAQVAELPVGSSINFDQFKTIVQG